MSQYTDDHDSHFSEHGSDATSNAELAFGQGVGACAIASSTRISPALWDALTALETALTSFSDQDDAEVVAILEDALSLMQRAVVMLEQG